MEAVVNPQAQQNRFVRVGIAALVILAASFMPWFTIRQSLPFVGMGLTGSVTVGA